MSSEVEDEIMKKLWRGRNGQQAKVVESQMCVKLGPPRFWAESRDMKFLLLNQEGTKMLLNIASIGLRTPVFLYLFRPFLHIERQTLLRSL